MSKNPPVSKFAGILAAKHEEHDQDNEPKPELKKRKSSVEIKSEINPEVAPSESAAATNNRTRRGRPPAKRSNPDFVQTSPYIRKTTLLAVKSKLLNEGEKREYSELVEELLTKWLSI